MLLYQCNFPGARPFLQPLLPMDGLLNVVKAFEMDQPLHFMISDEAFGRTRLVLIHATNEIVGYANIGCAADAAGKHIDVVM